MPPTGLIRRPPSKKAFNFFISIIKNSEEGYDNGGEELTALDEGGNDGVEGEVYAKEENVEGIKIARSLIVVYF